MKIKILQKHIDNGIRDSKCHCPIACALMDVGFVDCEVHANYIVLDYSKRNKIIKTSDYLQNKIHEFDHTGKMEPFEFELNVENKMKKCYIDLFIGFIGWSFSSFIMLIFVDSLIRNIMCYILYSFVTFLLLVLIKNIINNYIS